MTLMVVPHVNTINKYKLLVSQRVGVLTFLDAFSTEEECIDLYFALKFSDHVCTKCGRPAVSNYSRILRKRAYRCKSCHTEIYPFSDTIFKNSGLPIRDIFYIIFMISDPKNSISALEITRLLNISYKAAHRTMILIRAVLGYEHGSKMSGMVEIDEAFIGKGSKVYNWSSISTRKQPIIGIVERGTGKSRLFLANDRKSATIRKLVLNNVEIGSTVYTDSWRGYLCLEEYYKHESVDHSSREWVRGKVHTNTIENIWRHLKRNIRGAHIKIGNRYVQQYINEACWKNNERGKSQIQLFDNILLRSFFSDSFCAVTKKKVKFFKGGKPSVVESPCDLIAV